MEGGGFLDYVRDGSILHGQAAWLVRGLEWASTAISLLGCAILFIGATRFVVAFLRAELSGDRARRVRGVDAGRAELGRYILAGLEFLIVADIVHTAISLAMIDLVFLAFLVVIRSLISFFLDRELEQLERELRS